MILQYFAVSNMCIYLLKSHSYLYSIGNVYFAMNLIECTAHARAHKDTYTETLQMRRDLDHLRQI